MDNIQLGTCNEDLKDSLDFTWAWNNRTIEGYLCRDQFGLLTSQQHSKRV